MSDQSQGPDWWMANDGKWYPPESHPGFGPPPHSGSVPPQAEPPNTPAASDLPTCPNGHEVPPGQRFCGQCGSPVSEGGGASVDPTADSTQASETAAVAPSPAPQGGGEAPTQSDAWLRRNWWVGALAALIAILVIAAIAGGGESDENDLAATVTTNEDDPTTTTDATTTTSEPSTTTTTVAESGTRENPDPLGKTYEVTGQDNDGTDTAWAVTVNSVDLDGWPEIQGENQFNDPPASGWRFVMVRLTATYKEGAKAESPGYVVSVSATGSNNTVYDESSAMPNGGMGCGVAPDELSSKDELLPGGTASGNVCVPVTEAEISNGSLRLLIEPAFSFDDDPIWVTPFK